MATTRARLYPCSPAGWAQPSMRSSISVRSSCGHPVERGLHDRRREVVGADVDERSLVGPPDRAAGGGDDHGLGHAGLLGRGWTPTPYWAGGGPSAGRRSGPVRPGPGARYPRAMRTRGADGGSRRRRPRRSRRGREPGARGGASAVRGPLRGAAVRPRHRPPPPRPRSLVRAPGGAALDRHRADRPRSRSPGAEAGTPTPDRTAAAAPPLPTYPVLTEQTGTALLFTHLDVRRGSTSTPGRSRPSDPTSSSRAPRRPGLEPVWRPAGADGRSPLVVRGPTGTHRVSADGEALALGTDRGRVAADALSGVRRPPHRRAHRPDHHPRAGRRERRAASALAPDGTNVGFLAYAGPGSLELRLVRASGRPVDPRAAAGRPRVGADALVARQPLALHRPGRDPARDRRAIGRGAPRRQHPPPVRVDRDRVAASRDGSCSMGSRPVASNPVAGRTAGATRA